MASYRVATPAPAILRCVLPLGAFEEVLAVAPQPLYSPATLTGPGYHLQYTGAGCPSSETFPLPLSDRMFRALDDAWEQEGRRRLEQRLRSEIVQFTFGR